MKAFERFKGIINEMDEEQLRKMALGLSIFTKLCIDHKFKTQRNAIIDFAIIAKYTYFDKALKAAKENKELPY